MQDFRANEANTVSIQGQKTRPIYGAYVGMDVHKDTIAVAAALAGREAPAYCGEIANRPSEIGKTGRQAGRGAWRRVDPVLLRGGAVRLRGASPTDGLGFRLRGGGAIADPQGAGRTDQDGSAGRVQAGAVVAQRGVDAGVWVPDEEQEAMRDLVRARADFKNAERKTRQQLGAFLLRHGRHWSRSRWTLAHYAWLDGLRFERDWQEWAFREYLDAVRAASDRVAALTKQLDDALPSWSMAPVVRSLVALRGVDRITAMTLLSELGDVSRFDSPRQLMAYVGLVPSEHSSGARRHQGGITRTGNGHVRRTLVESAWSYRFPARRTAHLERKAAAASDEAKEIAWKAQRRLCGRYRHLLQAGKNSKQANVAVARELSGFVWDIVRREMPRVPPAPRHTSGLVAIR